jgi:hypothetical protein
MKHGRGRKVAWLLLGVVVLVAAAAAWTRRAPPTRPAPVGAATRSGLMDSSAHVAATLTPDGHGGGTVQLRIDPDWHVNANPASLEQLIATTVLVEESGALHAAKASYPPGRDSGIMVNGTDIRVYDDGTAIKLQRLPAAHKDQMRVRVQSCNTEGVCLAPATLPITKVGSGIDTHQRPGLQ